MKAHWQRHGLIAATAIACAAAAPANADSFTQWAQVVRATPVYVRVSDPRPECWTERVTTEEYVDRNGVPLGAIVGGITGGVIGNQVGGGRGRDAATIGGAVAGAAIGNTIDRERAGITTTPVVRDIEHCRTVDAGRNVLDGYDVTYRYQNRDMTTRLPYDPGDRLQVRVDVEVAPR